MTLSSLPRTRLDLKSVITKLDFKIGDIVLLEKIFRQDAFFYGRETLENWLYVLETVPDICPVYDGSESGIMVELTPLFTSNDEGTPYNTTYNFISVRITKL